MILTSLQKLSSNVGDLGKIIVATSFEWLPKVQKIAQSGHTAANTDPNLLQLNCLIVRGIANQDTILIRYKIMP